MTDEREQWMMEALESVYAEWYNYTHSTSIVSQAGYWMNLSGRLSDLFTYHPRFNGDTGEIGGVFDD